MTHTLVNLSGRTLMLCNEHKHDAMMRLWHECDGTWSASITGHAHCDACAPLSGVPAGFRAALARQAMTNPRASLAR